MIVRSAPLNGQVDCGSGLVNMGVDGDNCTFSCDPGYMLQGSINCENSGSWSGGSQGRESLQYPLVLLYSLVAIVTML